MQNDAVRRLPLRGEIYYILDSNRSSGSEQRGGRPGIILSNNTNNRYSSTVEIVYCTSRPKRPLPTHVAISGLFVPSTALCEQVTTVSVERLDNRIGRCSDAELCEIEKAVLISLGIKQDRSDRQVGAVYA